jgi:hypothetical protein
MTLALFTPPAPLARVRLRRSDTGAEVASEKPSIPNGSTRNTGRLGSDRKEASRNEGNVVGMGGARLLLGTLSVGAVKLGLHWKETFEMSRTCG